MIPWVSPSPQSKWHHDQFNCFHTGDRRVSLYFTMGAPFPQNCPFPWGSGPPSNTWFLGPIRAHNQMASLLVQPFSQRWPQSVPILYNGMPLSPLKIAPSHEGIWTLSNTWFTGPTRVLNQNGISIGSAILAGSLVWQTDWQTTLLSW